MRAWIVVLCLLSATGVAAKERAAGTRNPANATVEIGTHHGASYRIDIPANWNRGLVVFFHGYAIDPVAFRDGERVSPMFDPILGAGFAVIQSAYSKPGWAVEEGSTDSERLRAYFVARHGPPKETFAMGMSMGGTLTVLAIESAPTVYAGALSLCGAIEPTDALMQRDFALRAAFDYYFPDVLGALVPVAPDYVPTNAVVARIGAAMRAKPDAYAALRAIYGAGDSRSLPDVIAFITYDIKEMQQRTHGNPFGNADLVYTGPADNFALNDGVRRYRADPRASAYMSRWYTPNGKLLKPLLALHDSGDPLVVASTAFSYALLAQRAAHADNFVQQYVNAEGHCVFTPAQIGHAFDELVDWSRGGQRPASGRLR
ncbi:MAG: alpha/beta hydrolase [Lysobacterales bacterium]